jgi:myosin-5
MKSYYLEDSIVTQTVTELLRLVGVTAFNDLLMRRNFLSWKRGLQINYNITRIEEWCKSHDMPEGTLQLEHLMVSIIHYYTYFTVTNCTIASNQIATTQESYTERHRDNSGHLLDVS